MLRFLLSLFQRAPKQPADQSQDANSPPAPRRPTYLEPAVPAASVQLKAFACPHCGAHTAQDWYTTFVRPITGDNPTPFVADQETLNRIEAEVKDPRNREHRELLERHREWVKRLMLGLPFLEKHSKSTYLDYEVENLFISKCYTCSKLAFWVHDRLIFPPTRSGPPPNSDLPADVLRDYEEASTILDLSPRGAAALLRLAIEKLCTDVGAKGDDINAQIAWLVANGLPEKIQQALDAVRVIGNEAVHPGQMNLRDDRDTASELFELVNIIAEEMITRPKRVQAVYDKIPPSKKVAIEKRDGKPT